jgi:hypothetical protein
MTINGLTRKAETLEITLMDGRGGRGHLKIEFFHRAGIQTHTEINAEQSYFTIKGKNCQRCKLFKKLFNFSSSVSFYCLF